MSIFSTIITDLKSFASKIEAEFKKLFKEAPSWLAIAQGVLTYVGPIVVTIIDLAGGPAIGAEANTIITAIKTKLATAAALASNLGSATDISTVLADVQNDLPAFLAALQVKDEAVVSKITGYTAIISTELTALLNALNPPTVTLPATEVAA